MRVLPVSSLLLSLPPADTHASHTMTVVRRLRIVSITAVITSAGMEVGAQHLVPDFGALVRDAEARIGRPITPFSVAGVARRTVRRCAVGVYYC